MNWNDIFAASVTLFLIMDPLRSAIENRTQQKTTYYRQRIDNRTGSTFRSAIRGQ